MSNNSKIGIVYFLDNFVFSLKSETLNSTGSDFSIASIWLKWKSVIIKKAKTALGVVENIPGEFMENVKFRILERFTKNYKWFRKYPSSDF